MDMIDTTTEVGKGLLSIYKKYDRIKIGGYMQSQFQVAQSKGTKSYNGGDFPATSDNRFMLRRGRIRFEYVHFSDNTKPSVQFVFQFDGTERGVFIRDFTAEYLKTNGSFLHSLPACLPGLSDTRLIYPHQIVNLLREAACRKF